MSKAMMIGYAVMLTFGAVGAATAEEPVWRWDVSVVDIGAFDVGVGLGIGVELDDVVGSFDLISTARYWRAEADAFGADLVLDALSLEGLFVYRSGASGWYGGGGPALTYVEADIGSLGSVSSTGLDVVGIGGYKGASGWFAELRADILGEFDEKVMFSVGKTFGRG